MEQRAAKASLREATLTALRDIADKHGAEVPAWAVREAATALGCTERHVWRLVAKAKALNGSMEAVMAATTGQRAWTPTEDLFKRLVVAGSVAALRKQLVREAGGNEEAVPGLRTMQRGFEQRFSTAQTAWARGGQRAAQQHLPTARIIVDDLNEEWSVDDTLVPVWCVMPDGTVEKPSLQMFVEASTRLVITQMFAPTPFSTEDTVENLASAVAGYWQTVDGFDEAVFVGGKPARIRSDRGSIFVHSAMTKGLLGVAVDRVFTQEYTPQQNGKHERLHRTLKSDLKWLPGYDWSDWKDGDPRKARIAPPAKDLLLYEEVIGEVMKVIEDYRRSHVHSAHGKTPLAAWAEAFLTDPDAVVLADPVALRASMRKSKRVKLRRQRIQWQTRLYEVKPYAAGENVTPELLEQRRRWIDNAEGRDVLFKFLPTHVEDVAVYDEFGHYLGDAIWDEHQTPEDAAESAKRRRYHRQVFRNINEDIARNGAEAVAARREEALAHAAATTSDDDAEPTVTAAQYRTNHPAQSGKTGSKKSGRRKTSAAEQTISQAEEARRAMVAQAAARHREARGA